ncbi:DDE-type integrase/transposase/recombinase (plasmid) [Mesorhizobium huakuii 7653R]|nr:DDE-type integrase/transposase/recombinase [Mesorhizobium huakuii 7653R]
MGRSIDVRLTVAALKAAIERRKPPPGCVHHSDRGAQYAARLYRNLLAEHDLIGSMRRRGNPYDNAKAESFMKTMKVEAVYPMAYETFTDVAEDLPASLMRFTTPADCTQRSAISARNSSKTNTPGRWSKLPLDPVRSEGRTPLGAAQQLPDVCSRDVRDQTSQFDQERDRRQSKYCQATDFLPLHPPSDFLGEAGPQVADVDAPEVRFVIGQIERREIEINPTMVKGIAIRDHRPFEVAFGHGGFVGPDTRSVSNDVTAQILVDGCDRPDPVFVAALHRHQHIRGMLGDHLAIENAMMAVADQHQVVGLLGKIG